MTPQEAHKKLHEMLEPGDTIYTSLNHVSRSGMLRAISLLVGRDKDVIDVSFYAAKAMGDKLHPKGGIKISGCGMDMGFALVYNLGWALWPKGFDTPKGYWRNEPMDFDPDGGYALTHRWI